MRSGAPRPAGAARAAAGRPAPPGSVGAFARPASPPRVIPHRFGARMLPARPRPLRLRRPVRIEARGILWTAPDGTGLRGFPQGDAPFRDSVAGRAGGVRRRRGLRRPRLCRARLPRGRSGSGEGDERTARSRTPRSGPRGRVRRGVRPAEPPGSRRSRTRATPGVTLRACTASAKTGSRMRGSKARRGADADGIASGRRRRRPARRRADERRETAASAPRRASPHSRTADSGSPEQGGRREAVALRPDSASGRIVRMSVVSILSSPFLKGLHVVATGRGGQVQ